MLEMMLQNESISVNMHPLFFLHPAKLAGCLSDFSLRDFSLSQISLIDREISLASERKNKEERSITKSLSGWKNIYEWYIKYEE